MAGTSSADGIGGVASGFGPRRIVHDSVEGVQKLDAELLQIVGLLAVLQRAFGQHWVLRVLPTGFSIVRARGPYLSPRYVSVHPSSSTNTFVLFNSSYRLIDR